MGNPGSVTSRRWPTLEERAELALKPGTAIDAPALIQLIHEVNPSGRELAPDVQRRRYQLKGRLQSSLILKFKEQLEVTPLPESDEVVGLRYRPQNRDACHAIVVDLDVAARSWVRLALDIGKDPPPSPSVPAPARRRKSGPARTAATELSTPEELLRAGGAAAAAFDFEMARECFDRALELSDGGAEAAQALLGLLVEQLAAYAD